MFQVEEGGVYYTVPPTAYTYSDTAFTLEGHYEAFLDQTNGWLGSFDSTAEFRYGMNKIDKITTPFTGMVQAVSSGDELEGVFATSILNKFWSAGDGSSPGGVNVTVNYSGTKEVSKSNAIVVVVSGSTVLDENELADTAGGGTLSTAGGTVNVTGLPDGNYYVIAYLDENRTNDEIDGNASHVFHGGGYYSDAGGTLAGTATHVVISSGAVQNVTINLTDDRLFPVMTESKTTLNSISATYNPGTKKVTVTVDLNKESQNITGIGMRLVSPRTYSVYGVIDVEDMFTAGDLARGQNVWVNQNTPSGDIWTFEIDMADNYESGNWLVELLQIGLNGGGQIIYSLQQRGNLMENYDYHEGWDAPRAQTAIPAAFVSVTTASPDTVGPAITAIGFSSSNTEFISADTITTGQTRYLLIQADDIDFLGSASYAGRIIISRPTSESTSIDDPEDDAQANKQYQLSYDYTNDVYWAEIPGDDLTETGLWTVRFVRIFESVYHNASNYLLYDHSFWNSNPFGIVNDKYYLYNYEAKMPVVTTVSPASIERI